MPKKITYRVRNWKDYNRSLVNRGNLTLWFSNEAIKRWYEKPSKQKKRGRNRTYSDRLIELALTLRSLFNLTLRGTQGFLTGLVKMLGRHLKVPHYSRLSRRGSTLNISLKRFAQTGKQATDIVIDSTGLKVYGEGEWKSRTHGKQKRRTWRKYHVAIDAHSHEVISVLLTDSNMHDCKIMAPLLSELDKLGHVYADGAYTFKENFDVIAEKGGIPFIPIRSGTSFVKKPHLSRGEQLRNELLREMLDVGGKAIWKKQSGYHRRSLVETHMSRLKAILGGGLRARKFDNQKTEAFIKANILNTMTSLGMPISEKIF